MSTLSAIVVTRHPSERAIELLRTVRGVVDELVVAVDDRAGEGGLGALEELADTVALFEFTSSIERQWEWIASLATGDWILWLDDDELPSPALVASLRGLVEATDVTHYLLRRTWIWPDAAEALSEPPWDPDLSPRLYRADPALVWYPGILHVPVKHIGPSRLVDEPLYHVDLVHNTEQSRRAKAARYELLRPGLRVAGRPQNEAVYLPEDRSNRPATVAVPDGDREAIERFLSSSCDPIDARPPTRPVTHGTAEMIAAAYRGASDAVVDDGAIELVGPIDPVLAGVERSVEVRVENRGSDWWAPGGFHVSDVFVSYRWYAPDGAIVAGEGLRTPLPVGVPPGGSELVAVDVIPPSDPGRYSLGLDLVREHVHWFGCELRVDVDVLRVPTVGVLVDPADLSTAVDVARVLTEAVPGARLTLLARDPGSTSAATGYPAAADPTAEALGDPPLRLLLAATRSAGRSVIPQEATSFDLVVVTGAARLAGSAGRREALALAAFMRALERQGVGIVVVGGAESESRDPVGRITTRALRLADGAVAPGAESALAAAVVALLDR